MKKNLILLSTNRTAIFALLILANFFIGAAIIQAADTKGTTAGAGVDVTKIDLCTVFRNTANWVAGIAGGLAMLIIVVGGIQWALSGGDDEKTANARKTIVAAFIGLAITLLAYTIVWLLFNTVFGSGSDICVSIPSS
jgi:hypothetical protein